MRRTVNGLGHVLMLEGVQAFLCEQEDLLMRCHIELQNGRLFDRTMIQMEESAKQNE
ncbi:ComGF family competence protein [Bacillus sp. JCM 19034]|uniref:ComGF family competence protein n=1 Tax=Bacillus sp. JCM 19034 TaxID=1481928 RepID=UPI001E573995|nr:ComGF family competence protein [Bacillus sp. JCM 19034]